MSTECYEDRCIYHNKVDASCDEQECKRKPVSKEYILCAAIWFSDGKTHEHQPKNVKHGFIICGRRHHNCYATKWIFDKTSYPNTQGFITNRDRFVDRTEAYMIACLSGQINEDPEIEGTLISEDLY